MPSDTRKFFRYFLPGLVCALAAAAPAQAEKTNYETAGDIGQVVIPLTALGISVYDGSYTDTKKLLASFATTMVVTHTAKNLINEERPNGGQHSFPSGHTASAFSGASFIFSEYGWKAGVPAYLGASYVGWSRVYANKHWPHDVLAGAALAVSINYLYSYVFRDTGVTPLVGENFVALSFSHQL